MPHSSQWGAAFPDYEIGVHLVSDILRDGQPGGVSFTAGGRAFSMPKGCLFHGEADVFYRANHRTDPRHDFRFVATNGEQGWHSIVAVDRPAVMNAAFCPFAVESWAHPVAHAHV